MKSHFSGYASKAGLLCSDGRTIEPHAFEESDGKEIPIYLEHRKTGVQTELGRAVVEDRDDGSYVYGTFNETPEGQKAKELVKNGKIVSLSARATDLVHRGASVISGVLEEVSLVLKGANPGASIQNVTIAHSAGYPMDMDDEAIIYTGLTLEHSDIEGADMANENEGGEETVKDVLETLSEKQMKAVAYVIDQLREDSSSDDSEKDLEHSESEEDDEEDEEFEVEVEAATLDKKSKKSEGSNTDDEDDKKKTLNHSDKEHQMGTTHNIFDGEKQPEERKNTLTHSQISEILRDAKKVGSLKESVMEHADEYGFQTIDLLFPDAKAGPEGPAIFSRRNNWVAPFLSAVRHSPFSRIKSIVADITADEARARGYVKGNLKKEEVIKLLRRTTTPTTIYKKQKLDRDDIIDITDFDVVAFMKSEMRVMLDEEIARAVLVGDGRSVDDESKIDEESIRPIAFDDDMYAEKVTLPSNTSIEDKMEAMIRARADYRGTGNPTLYTTMSFVTDILLLKDKMGRRLYRNLDEVASELLAAKIETVDVLEAYPTVAAIYVNPNDYTIGADKGGEVNFFDDFDIDFNQKKYLLETRISGSLSLPKSAVVLLMEEGNAATPVSPSFDGATNELTIPTTEGITYMIDGLAVTGKQTITSTTEVTARAKGGYYIPANTTTHWTFVYTEPTGE